MEFRRKVGCDRLGGVGCEARVAKVTDFGCASFGYEYVELKIKGRVSGRAAKDGEGTYAFEVAMDNRKSVYVGEPSECTDQLNT